MAYLGRSDGLNKLRREQRIALHAFLNHKSCRHRTERHGHAIGDDVLRGIAGVIRASLPEGSHAGRLGGDEFAIVMPVAAEQAHGIAEGIRIGVATLDLPTLPSLRSSVSIGSAEPPTIQADLRSWMEAADHALYRAKAAGRDRVASTYPGDGTLPAMH